MTTLRQWGIGGLLALGFAIVLGAPAWLLWFWLSTPTWDPQAVAVRFEWLRAEHDTIVFAYQLENTSARPVHMAPEIRTLHVLETGKGAALGEPAIHLPEELAPFSSQRVEVRLVVPNPWTGPYSGRPGNDPRPVLSAPLEDPEAAGEKKLRATLDSVQGFELVDDRNGMRLVFPRGW